MSFVPAEIDKGPLGSLRPVGHTWLKGTAADLFLYCGADRREAKRFGCESFGEVKRVSRRTAAEILENYCYCSFCCCVTSITSKVAVRNFSCSPSRWKRNILLYCVITSPFPPQPRPLPQSNKGKEHTGDSCVLSFSQRRYLHPAKDGKTFLDFFSGGSKPTEQKRLAVGFSLSSFSRCLGNGLSILEL